VWPIEGPLGIPTIESDHTILATVLPIENLPLARVLIRVRNRPLQECVAAPKADIIGQVHPYRDSNHDEQNN